MYDHIAHLFPEAAVERERHAEAVHRIHEAIRAAQRTCEHARTHEHRDPNGTDDWTECLDCGAERSRGQWRTRVEGLVRW